MSLSSKQARRPTLSHSEVVSAFLSGSNEILYTPFEKILRVLSFTIYTVLAIWSPATRKAHLDTSVTVP